MSNTTNSNLENNTVLVIFGSTGNLVEKKLIPALYHLLNNNNLPKNFKIICIARDKNTSLQSIYQKAQIAILKQQGHIDDKLVSQLISMSYLLIMDSTLLQDYQILSRYLDDIDNNDGLNYNRLYYLAIPPSIFYTVIDNLGKAGLNINNTNTNVSRRILIEKPFGTNLQTAQELVNHIAQYFNEFQVFRIDHYLAKETAQNILAFRANNPIFEDLWGRQFIDHIQITAAENIDIENRADFYDNMGALRDLVQSHILQLLALTTMEIPDNLTSKNIHHEKLQLLNSVKIINPKHIDELVIRGQYQGYRQEANKPDSTTETYVAMNLEVTNSRWGGVPIVIRTGKALTDRVTEINVVFQDRSRRQSQPNILSIRIQPNEGISIMLQAKKPGLKNELQTVNMDFCYETSFNEWQPDAYERVLVDAIVGDQTLFATSDEVLRCWQIIQPILDVWGSNQLPLYEYPKGSWGPKQADEFAANLGCQWYSNDNHVCQVHK